MIEFPLDTEAWSINLVLMEGVKIAVEKIAAEAFEMGKQHERGCVTSPSLHDAAANLPAPDSIRLK